jgi:hypothetical protein
LTTTPAATDLGFVRTCFDNFVLEQHSNCNKVGNMGFFSEEHEDGTGPVPGTVHLVDLDGTMRARHAKGSDVVLVPAPSQDPDDPVRSRSSCLWCILIPDSSIGLLLEKHFLQHAWEYTR